ncbi:MAG: hypothetical protein RsTaC01_0523 [Candidatus Paraimprobicoccus trichonymphae]|uniref:Uncharacterized protein n=1 Tax=Candidatus Paraimprobicoccus trichonymphae TaxID=3033793 RepID=A0AA48I2Q6_9FIRM|nr:MAG: hypothetical protein RsTaC01_0523 [Candidatus Paraimprobicoccus trichonymphae]
MKKFKLISSLLAVLLAMPNISAYGENPEKPELRSVPQKIVSTVKNHPLASGIIGGCVLVAGVLIPILTHNKNGKKDESSNILGVVDNNTPKINNIDVAIVGFSEDPDDHVADVKFNLCDENSYKEQTEFVIGVEFKGFGVGEFVTRCWNLSETEKFRSFIPNYLMKAKLVVLVCSKAKTNEKILEDIERIRNHNDAPILLFKIHDGSSFDIEELKKQLSDVNNVIVDEKGIDETDIEDSIIKARETLKEQIIAEARALYPEPLT